MFSGSKYVEIKYRVVRDEIKDGQTIFEYISMEAMVAELVRYPRYLMSMWLEWVF